ncbi:MAG: 7-cyano-7-deazaguanine synthase QueC [Candidatus Hadarchaeota archaeon]
MKKAVCLLSGGPDSATAAAVAKRDGYEVHCLTFDYGQIAPRELESAKLVAKKLGVKFRTIDLSSIKGLYGSGVTALTDAKMKMPERFEPSVIVPFRNGIMLSIAAAYAAAIGAGAIYYGAQKDDSPFYPDCRSDFADAMSNAISCGTGLKIRVKNPLARLGKADVIRLAAETKVPLELTWSCYLNGPLHCGRCESCRNRKKAFREAGMEDPTEYVA